MSKFDSKRGKQPSVALKKTESWQNANLNHSSFDAKNKNTEETNPNEILTDSIHLNIKQILQERPTQALRIEENYGTNTNEDH